MFSIIFTAVVSLSVAQIIAIAIFKDAIINFYTDETEVYDAISPAWWVLLIFIFFDSMQSIGTGTLNALKMVGQIKWTATINYWFLGIPLACLLMFKYEMNLEGLWWGPTLAVFNNCVYYGWKLTTVGWQ